MGAVKMTSHKDRIFLNKDQHSVESAKDVLLQRPNSVISELQHQHRLIDEIFSNTLNTVRVRTYIDPAVGKSFVGCAVLKLGSEKSYPVDNWHAGGLVSTIDLESGMLGRAAAKTKSDEFIWYDSHPDTGVQITGKVVPFWDEITELANLATEAYGGTTSVGWDIAITPNGPVFIEGNNYPNLLMLQLGGGLLSNERIRKYYQFHGFSI
ncbi:hypothetical protein G3T16_04180 [Kineobactrum salinum]|uniref:Alpha-L-glutamate ligase-related protein ATP-grasp domain-containing protein n=2 Tax=Kineobactrum salinum TaxID=2708301 RepID=A0A6C0TY61_9GAMM|nr:hypothetical protein G3T16_04180 [Kineobactrum salinum]